MQWRLSDVICIYIYSLGQNRWRKYYLSYHFGYIEAKCKTVYIRSEDIFAKLAFISVCEPILEQRYRYDNGASLYMHMLP